MCDEMNATGGRAADERKAKNATASKNLYAKMNVVTEQNAQEIRHEKECAENALYFRRLKRADSVKLLAL